MLMSRAVDESTAHLWERLKQHGDGAARRALILHYAPLVRRALDRSHRFLSQRVERGELASCGMLGLMDAIEKFRTDRNIKFETYASIRIQGAMLDHLRSLDWLPRRLRQQARELEEARRALEHRLGRTPTQAEVAAHMGVHLSRLRKLLSDLHLSTVVSLESAHERTAVGDIPLRDLLADPSASPEQRLVESDQRLQLASALALLPERERNVVALYYFEDLTLREIGQVISLSEAAISAIHTAALSRLRSALHDEQPPRKP